MKKLPIGIQTFENIIQEDYLYVDKTASIYKLITEGKYYFLSRPRRFGKSLLLSTIKAIFEGKKELFKSLWIYDKITWKKQPIIHLDFSGMDYYEQDLSTAILQSLQEIAKSNKFVIESETPKTFFKELIIQLQQAYQQKVVILIDEYDKPLIDYLNDKPQAEKNRALLKSFYGIIKSTDRYLQLVVLTGVSKFSKISIFSELNNLDDITIDNRFSTIVGITKPELTANFMPYYEAISKKLAIPMTALLEKTKHWYNGYSWDGENFVYNPFSLLNFFVKQDFRGFWFATGTPTFLVQMLRKHNRPLHRLEEKKVSYSFFEKFDLENIDVYSLLFQTGYLTIKKRTRRGIRYSYHLGYPNNEVRESFLKNLLEVYAYQFPTEVSELTVKLRDSLYDKEVTVFIQVLQSLFADISTHLLKQLIEKDRLSLWESYYQLVIYIIVKLLGIDIDCEVHTNHGRIDAMIEVEEYIYIMEFKVGTALEAMNQIKDRKYYEKYLIKKKEIILLGIGFDIKERNIKDYLVEVIENENDTITR